MARFSDKKLPKPTQDELWDEFCDLVAALGNREAVRDFFRDLLNRQERLMLARRLHVASLLEAGATYREIKKLLGAGGQLIARVARWLEFGRGGYKQAVRKLPTRQKRDLEKKYVRYYQKR